MNKRFSNQTPVSYPKTIKLYNNGMAGVDIMDYKQVLTDSIMKLVLLLLEKLKDVALVKSHIV